MDSLTLSVSLRCVFLPLGVLNELSSSVEFTDSCEMIDKCNNSRYVSMGGQIFFYAGNLALLLKANNRTAFQVVINSLIDMTMHNTTEAVHNAKATAQNAVCNEFLQAM